jgi:hypothetical protein
LYLHFISKKLEGFFDRAITIFYRFPPKNVRAIRRNHGGCSNSKSSLVIKNFRIKVIVPGLGGHILEVGNSAREGGSGEREIHVIVNGVPDRTLGS